MTHVVHPYSHRLVILRDWKSRWFAEGKDYVDNLKADVLLREFLEKRLSRHYVSSVEFERGNKTTRCIIRTSRPGMIIGRNGEGAQKIKADIEKMVRKLGLDIGPNFKLDIVDVENPDSDAAIIAASICEMLEKRLHFRRILKMIAEKTMQVQGVKGVRIQLSGRLGGAEMARTEEVKLGSIPLQFMRADIDYSYRMAVLSYGGIGVKVWVHRGDVLKQDKGSKAKKFRAGKR